MSWLWRRKKASTAAGAPRRTSSTNSMSDNSGGVAGALGKVLLRVASLYLLDQVGETPAFPKWCRARCNDRALSPVSRLTRRECRERKGDHERIVVGDCGPGRVWMCGGGRCRAHIVLRGLP